MGILLFAGPNVGMCLTFSSHFSPFPLAPMPLSPSPAPLDPVALTMDLARIPSVSGQEGEVVGFVDELLRGRGWEVHRIPVSPGRDAPSQVMRPAGPAASPSASIPGPGSRPSAMRPRL